MFGHDLNKETSINEKEINFVAFSITSSWGIFV